MMKKLILDYFPRNFRFAPRWAIFLLDLACVVSATILSLCVTNDFNINKVLLQYNLYNTFILILLINAILLYAFRAYKGVVRYTTFEDAGKLLLINFLVTTILNVVEFVYAATSTDTLILSFSQLVIYFLAVSFFQILFRLVVKRTFDFIFVSRKKKVKVAIYNARNDGRLVGKIISENTMSSMRVTAFLDENMKLVGKSIQGIPVLKINHETIAKLKSDDLEILIIADPYIKKDVLNELVDVCLEFDIRVQQIPTHDKWINNKLDINQLKDIKIEQLLEREEINLKNDKVHADIKGKTVLITGAAGSIGSEIVKQVIGMEPQLVIAVDNAETPLHNLKLSLNNDKNIIYFLGDIVDRMRMEQIFEIYQPDLVYHAAAYKHVPIMEDAPSLAVKNNVLGTKNLAQLSVEYSVKKFVMVSTDKAVNPTNVMGASKRIAEIYCQSYYAYLKSLYDTGKIKSTTKFITTRFGNVLGSNGSVIPRFKDQLNEGGPLTVTHPDITRYFMTIPEACKLVMEAGSMGNGGEIYVFDMGKPVKIVDLAKKMIRLSGKIPDKDIKIEFTGLRPGEKLYEELLNNSENTLPTYHSKILIAKVREYDFYEVQDSVDALIKDASNHTSMSTVAKMKSLVPEFISKNSIYESLDS